MTSRAPAARPTLRTERALLRGLPDGRRVLAAVDEVGRGALAGPVSVGVVLVDETVKPAPAEVRDSKLLSPQARERLVPRLRQWAPAYGVGHASPQEIDEVGILAALRLAGQRALDQAAGSGLVPSLVLLDGKHDWWTPPEQVGLFAPWDESTVPVRTQIKADMTCAAVAAASVLAKVERDTLVVALAADGHVDPAYGLAVNKGYASPGHLDALRRLGPTTHHRRSWRLPERTDPASSGMGDDGRTATPTAEEER